MTEATARPDPDALLRKLTAQAEREKRAKLRIFFGFAPGVGKTYRMLQAARDLVEQNVDVLVGAVETHGRYETSSLLLGLDLLPRKQIEYRGRVLEEFDLEAALARRPRVLVLDELAHTNVSGSVHPKRWQDVIELLEAGIDVYTTLNVQHIESLNDVVAQITHVHVRETVPDSIFERADEIELVDISPEELLTRLREGKVYLGEQAARAAEHFFQKGNLLALRELALRRTVERVDADVLAHRESEGVITTWPTSERILVCVGPAPASARLIRSARRMAAGLRAPWVAAYVDSTVLGPLGDAERARLDAHLRLAESLGATVVRLSQPNVSRAILEYARKHNVTRIIIGKPTHSRLRDLLHGSVLDEVVRGSGDIDVHVITGDTSESRPPRARERPAPRLRAREYIWSAAWVAAATALASLARGALAAPDVVMVYLLTIMLSAVRFGRGPSVLAAALSVLAFDFFFIPPLYTFAVADVRHVLTFITMFVVGVLISTLTLRMRRQEQEARAGEARTAALFALSRELGAAIDEYDVAQVLTRHTAGVFRGAAAVIFQRGADLQMAAQNGEVPFGSVEQGVCRWVFERGHAAGLGTDTLPGTAIVCLPIRAGGDVLGVLALAPAEAHVLTADERDLLEAFVPQPALAIERARLAETAKAAALRARTEEMRSSLLSAVSHDLRTPLAAITGAATTLRDGRAHVPAAERVELLETICEESERLERLVGNLLDMTRLESGALQAKREWVPLEEIVGSALTRLEHKLGERPVRVRIGQNLPLLSVDPVLFEQVFVNLLENAAKYTPTDTAIDINAGLHGGVAVVEVRDHGPGLPAGSERSVFDKFFRGAHAGVAGVGLGLSICRAVVEAHGGSISAANRPDGGAVFRIELPVTGEPPRVSAAPAEAATVAEAPP